MGGKEARKTYLQTAELPDLLLEHTQAKRFRFSSLRPSLRRLFFWIECCSSQLEDLNSVAALVLWLPRTPQAVPAVEHGSANEFICTKTRPEGGSPVNTTSKPGANPAKPSVDRLMSNKLPQGVALPWIPQNLCPTNRIGILKNTKVGSVDSRRDHTIPQINMEAHIEPFLEDSSLVRGPSPLPC